VGVKQAYHLAMARVNRDGGQGHEPSMPIHVRAVTMVLLACVACDPSSGRGGLGGVADGAPAGADGGGGRADAAATDTGGPDAGAGDDACPAYAGGGMVCAGSRTIENADDVAAASACVEITGNLVIDAQGMTEIELPVLERVAGDILIWGTTSLVRISLPALKEAAHLGTGSRVADAALAEILVPQLRNLSVGVFIGTDTAVETQALPCLASTGWLNIEGRAVDAPRLTAVTHSVWGGRLDAPRLSVVGETLRYEGGDLPALTRVGDLTLHGAAAVSLPALSVIDRKLLLGCWDPNIGGALPSAPSVALPALVEAGSLRICPWPELAAVDLPELARLTGSGQLGANDVDAGGQLGSLALPSLATVAGNMDLAIPTDLPVLTTIDQKLTVRAPVDAPSLSSAGAVTFEAPLSAPLLAAVSGLVTSTSQDLTFPSLMSAGGVTAEQGVSLPSLQTVSGGLVLVGDGGDPIELGALRTIGDRLRVIRRRAPTALFDLGALESVGGYVVLRLDTPSVELPVLGSVGADLSVTRTTATEVRAPSLTSIAGGLSVNENTRLTAIDFGSLASLGTPLYISNNSQLASCQVAALEAQLRAAGWTGQNLSYGNDDDGTCP
jgi:hypothetical protein